GERGERPATALWLCVRGQFSCPRDEAGPRAARPRRGGAVRREGRGDPADPDQPWDIADRRVSRGVGCLPHGREDDPGGVDTVSPGPGRPCADRAAPFQSPGAHDAGRGVGDGRTVAAREGVPDPYRPRDGSPCRNPADAAGGRRARDGRVGGQHSRFLFRRGDGPELTARELPSPDALTVSGKGVDGVVAGRRVVARYRARVRGRARHRRGYYLRPDRLAPWRAAGG